MIAIEIKIKIIPVILKTFSSGILFMYFEAKNAPAMLPIAATTNVLKGKFSPTKWPIPPESEMKAIISTDVPTATRIGNPSMNIRATEIPIPPPTPKNPQKSPIIEPIIMDPSVFLFLKYNVHFEFCFFNGFLKKSIPVTSVIIPSPSLSARSGMYLANRLPIKANKIASEPIIAPLLIFMLFDFLYM